MQTELPDILKPYAHRTVRAVVADNSVADLAIWQLVVRHTPGDVGLGEYMRALREVSQDTRKVSEFYQLPRP